MPLHQLNSKPEAMLSAQNSITSHYSETPTTDHSLHYHQIRLLNQQIIIN